MLDLSVFRGAVVCGPVEADAGDSEKPGSDEGGGREEAFGSGTAES